MRAVSKYLIILMLFAALPALAAVEPPARVGRVSVVSGTLAFYGAGDTEWSAAQVNLPAATGGWFATDPQSRAQIRIGANSINLANDTQLNFADLGENVLQIALPQGRVDLHLRRAAWRKDDTVEIDIQRGAVWLLEPGVYDIDSGDSDRPTRIMVFEGSAKFVGGGVETVVKAGDALVVSGTDQLTTAVERAAPDEFVEWCRAHDYREDRVAKARHVSPGMTGFEELDEYGEWNTVGDYGAVWFPKAVPADWAPYRQGRWVWIEPWGWNWIDDAPWGFAPSHYGRWVRVDNRWGWVPGTFVPAPVYAPALVAYIPAPRIAVAVAAGPPVGWFPLAPGELYWPSYTRNPTYIRNVNISNVHITKITSVTKVVVTRPATAGPPPSVVRQRFANRDAATIVPAAVLTTSRPVGPAVVRVPASALRQMRVAVTPPAVVGPPAATAAPTPVEPRRGRRDLAGAAAQPGQAASSRRPDRPNFTGLAPAPRVRQLARQGRQPDTASPQSTPPTAPGPQAAQPPAQPPAPPPRTGAATPPAGAPATTQPPAQAASPAGKPGRPAGPPDFSNLAPTRRGGPTPTPPGQPATPTPQSAPPAAAGSAIRPGQDRAAERREELERQRAAEAAARQQARQRAESEAQQKAASDAAVREQARQKAAAEAAARQQAQQKAAGDAAARQQAEAARQAQQKAGSDAAVREQAQQRAAAEAAARQQAQQKAAGEAAARQQAEAARQAQQKAAGEAAARQQAQQAAQQRAAAEAVARHQQAQQKAAAEAAARQQAQQAAQQRAAAEAGARQQAQQKAAAAAARQQAAQRQAKDCVDGKGPNCPK